MNIAYVTTFDAHDPSIWAGSGYHIAKALMRQGASLQYIGPLRERRAGWFKFQQLLYQRIGKAALNRQREPTVLNGYARQVECQLANLRDTQLIFSPGTIPIAKLRTGIPIVTWTDATYASVVEEYIWELPTSKRSLALGHAMETEALQKCAMAIYSSEWAARSAIERYGVDPGKVKVVPFGANITMSRTPEDVQHLIDQRERDRCRLLFIGTGWLRKGADIAIEVARAVNMRGLPCELVMLGELPPPGVPLPDFVKPLGFLDKRSDEGRRRFDDLLGGSHFLILPARAEAFGVVLCEACSFGVPCLAGRVGGIPTIVREDLNGRTFPRECNPDEYARYVTDLFADFARYRALAESSFHEYQSRLNWDVSGEAVMRLLNERFGDAIR